MGRAALPLITAIAYLLVATTPCPPSAELRAAASHGSHDSHSSHGSHDHAAGGVESASFSAPCPCGCDPGATGSSVAKRGEAAVLIATSPAPLAPARSFDRERAEHLPDAPISVDSPVPIAA